MILRPPDVFETQRAFEHTLSSNQATLDGGLASRGRAGNRHHSSFYLPRLC